MDLLQAVAAGVETRPHVLGVQQRAVQAVGPLVIAADDVADRGLFVMDQPRAAMAADVVEGPKPHVVVAGDDDGGAVDIDHHAVARLRHVRLDADIDPVPPEDDVEIGLEDFRSGVEIRFQAVTRLAAPDQAFDRVRATRSLSATGAGDHHRHVKGSPAASGHVVLSRSRWCDGARRPASTNAPFISQPATSGPGDAGRGDAMGDGIQDRDAKRRRRGGLRCEPGKKTLGCDGGYRPQM